MFCSAGWVAAGVPERKAHFPRTDIKLFLDHLEPRGERTIQLAMLDQKEGYVGLRIPRGGGGWG